MSMVGKEGPLPLEDYAVVYKNTGVDIDGRLENLKTRVESRVRRVQCYVNFIERIPGFQSLPDIDKAALTGGKCDGLCVLNICRPNSRYLLNLIGDLFSTAR